MATPNILETKEYWDTKYFWKYIKNILKIY